MAKASRGGKAGSTIGQVVQGKMVPNARNNTNPVQTTDQQNQQPVQQPTIQITQSNGIDAFKNMTKDQKVDSIMQAVNTQVPVFLAQNDLQKVIYGLKLNDKPTLVDDSVLDTMPGKDLFRTVNSTTDTINRIKYGADEIGAQIIKGSVTRVSDTGGSLHGRGIYFADSYNGSTLYGNKRGDITKTAVIRVKMAPNARTISESRADSAVISEINSGSKLGKALSKVGRTDRTAIWALANNYDAIVAGNGYHVVINRSALVASKSIKAMDYNW